MPVTTAIAGTTVPLDAYFNWRDIPPEKTINVSTDYTN
jgi:hypothetical protein